MCMDLCSMTLSLKVLVESNKPITNIKCCASCKIHKCDCSCNTDPLLSSKFPISHQVHLIGEVHGHSQLDQEIDTESITALGYNWATCNKTSNVCKLQSLQRKHTCLCLFNPEAAHVDWTRNMTHCTADDHTQSHGTQHAAHKRSMSQHPSSHSLWMAHSDTCIHI